MEFYTAQNKVEAIEFIINTYKPDKVMYDKMHSEIYECPVFRMYGKNGHQIVSLSECLVEVYDETNDDVMSIECETDELEFGIIDFNHSKMALIKMIDTLRNEKKCDIKTDFDKFVFCMMKSQFLLNSIEFEFPETEMVREMLAYGFAKNHKYYGFDTDTYSLDFLKAN